MYGFRGTLIRPPPRAAWVVLCHLIAKANVKVMFRNGIGAQVASRHAYFAAHAALATVRTHAVVPNADLEWPPWEPPWS
eukprot:1196221-Prorocentrum_minimum.AAC.3